MHVPKLVIVVFLAACGLLGIGVATAAVGGEKKDDAEDPAVSTSEATTTSTPASTVPSTEAPADDGDVEGAAVARYYGPECGAEIPGGTHGDYVSRTAHEGGDVPTMAQSSCGKPVTAVQTETPETGAPDGEGKPESAGKPDDAGPPEGAGPPEDAGPPEGAGNPEKP